MRVQEASFQSDHASDILFEAFDHPQFAAIEPLDSNNDGSDNKLRRSG